MNGGMGVLTSLFGRHRIGLLITLAFLSVASAIVLVVGKERMPDFGGLLVFLGFTIALFYLVAVFLHSDSDVATPGSTYPTYYFTLPVKTSELALWPVLGGIIFVGLLTFGVSFAIDKAHYSFNYIGATFVVVSLLTTMQAVFWYPIGIPYSKLVLSIAVIVGLFLLGFSRSIWGIGEGVQTGIYIAVISISVGIAWLGVVKARSGLSIFNLSNLHMSVGDRLNLPPFSNPNSAQLWYEWRQQGRLFPGITLAFVLIFVAVSYTNDTLSPLDVLATSTEVMPTASTFLSVFYRMMIVLLPVFAWVVGFGMKRTELKRGDGSFHLYFATRPLADSSMVWAKFRVALKSTMWAWTFMVLATIPFLFTPAGRYVNGHSSGPEGMLYQILPEFLTPQILVMVLCGLLGFMFLSWRNLVVGLWTELSGNINLRYLQPFSSILIYIGVISLPSWVFKDMTWFAYLVVGLLVLKFALAIKVGFSMRTQGLLTNRQLVLNATYYVTCVLVLYGCACVVLGPTIAERQNAFSQELLWNHFNLLLVVLWWVPIVRILLATKMLSLNRHR